MKYITYLSHKTGFDISCKLEAICDISCKLSPLKTICMKCQILFSGENKGNVISLSSAELAQRVVKVNPVLEGVWTSANTIATI